MMKHELGKYDAYKDSGIEWIGEIPLHWDAVSVKRIAKNQKDVVQTGPFGAQLHASDYVDEGVPLILIRNVKNLWIDDSDIHRITEEKANQLSMYRLELGDIVFSRVGSIGRIALVTEREKGWMISGQMLRLRIRNPLLDKKYSIHAFSSDYISSYMSLQSLGATRESINTEILRNCVFLIPPLAEQTTIADYLDAKTTRIDRKIDLLTQKATQYGKLKQSLINETVTRGLDKSVAMKDSGVEWLGDVPKNWTVLRVKDTVIKIGNGVTPKGGSEVYTDAGIPFIRSQNVYDDGLHIGDVSFILDEIHRDMKGSQLKEGDILINITGASIGRTCVVPIELGIANINQHIAFLRTKYWFNTTYISLFLKSPFIKKYIQFEQNGASKEAFNLTQIANIPIVVPNIEEQKSIADYLDTKTAHIDRIVETINTQIEKLKELRKTLINDVVTGKIKVPQ